jgi:cold shock CspA family protein
MEGTITYFNNARGFGFVTTPDGQQYFFHVSNFVKGEAPPVLEGRVRFDIGPAISVGKKAQALLVHYIHEKKPQLDVAAILASITGKS